MSGTWQTAVPGLLQTRRYAEAIIRAANYGSPPKQIQRWIELRMARQQLLQREEPLRLHAVIDEAVVRRMVGGPAVMREQLSHLVKLSERPDIKIQVLPFTAGAHASPDGQFDLFRMTAPFPDAACMQTPSGTVYVESAEAERLAGAYDRLRQAAMSVDATVAFLSDLAARLE
ncbi:MAG TPA: DUF5753 domain-containing protein [Jiangellales bacterium]|nr:DUF5753 domain-containing protein [Jiangellales bacterium]